MKRLVLVLIVVLMGTPAFAQTLCPATPVDAKLDRFPIVLGKGTMPAKIGAGLGLKPIHLRFPFLAHNHHREINPKCGGSWVLEVIPAGTLVWVDEAGYVAYKDDCKNRLVYAGQVVQTPTPVPQPPQLRWLWQQFRDFHDWTMYRQR